MVDSVRGVGKALMSDRDVGEQTEATGVLSFGHNQITIGTDSAYNGSSKDLVLWSWKAGGNKNVETACFKIGRASCRERV